MIPAREALAHILATVPARRAERVAVGAAAGRVLAADVVAPVDVPPWDNSAMDGYAVRSADLGPDGGRLRVVGTVHAGEVPAVAVGPGEAVRIMTGAPMPPGADAVVAVEDSDRAEQGEVALRVGPPAGRFVRRRGGDVSAGRVVVAAGEVLGPGALGMLGALGVVEVEVARRPVVGVLTTGDEVVRAPALPGPGQIGSSNHLTVPALICEAGAVPVDLGQAPDDADAIAAALRAAAATCDVVLTTGGVSAGARDPVREAARRAGFVERFWKVRVKPGMPLLFAVDGAGVPLFGLPGNPVSCMVNTLQFVRPWLRSSMGDPTPFLPVVDAVAGEDIPSAPGRARFERCRMGVEGGRFVVRTTGDQGSGVLSSMVVADALMLLPPDHPGPRAGEAVRVQPMRGVWRGAAEPGYDF